MLKEFHVYTRKNSFKHISFLIKRTYQAQIVLRTFHKNTRLMSYVSYNQGRSDRTPYPDLEGAVTSWDPKMVNSNFLTKLNAKNDQFFFLFFKSIFTSVHECPKNALKSAVFMKIYAITN